MRSVINNYHKTALKRARKAKKQRGDATSDEEDGAPDVQKSPSEIDDDLDSQMRQRDDFEGFQSQRHDDDDMEDGSQHQTLSQPDSQLQPPPRPSPRSTRSPRSKINDDGNQDGEKDVTPRRSKRKAVTDSDSRSSKKRRSHGETSAEKDDGGSETRSKSASKGKERAEPIRDEAEIDRRQRDGTSSSR